MNRYWFRVTFFSILIFFLFLNWGCKEQESYVPYVPVNFTIDLNRFNSLTTNGYSQKYEFDGYGGVIIYCEFYDFASPVNSQYYAYDAACTLELTDTCSVENESNGLNAICPCCGSTYSLYNGYPINGDAQYPLKEYQVNLIDNKLYISN